MEPISADFEKELALLRDKLEEAEDVRRAITRGEVDAFVMKVGGIRRPACRPRLRGRRGRK